jgi:rhodanese-related sulfurtransferase
MSEIPEIDLDELERRIVGNPVIIDVREEDEFIEARIDGVLHIALGTVPERLSEIPTDVPVLVVCALGGRSARAVEFMRANGIDATNIAGGTLGWIESGRPVISGPASA